MTDAARGDLEGERRRSNILNFLVPIMVTRDSKGCRLIEPCPYTPTQHGIDREQWLATASTLSSQDLARELGITDRHPRRIKPGRH